jgi:hypothetical protein
LDFLLLLVPSIVISTFVLDFDTNIRTTIAFNISGSVCLGSNRLQVTLLKKNPH